MDIDKTILNDIETYKPKKPMKKRLSKIINFKEKTTKNSKIKLNEKSLKKIKKGNNMNKSNNRARNNNKNTNTSSKEGTSNIKNIQININISNNNNNINVLSNFNVKNKKQDKKNVKTKKNVKGKKNEKDNIFGDANFIVSKITNVFAYFLELIFKYVKIDIEKYQEENQEKKSMYNFDDKDMIIKKSDLAKAIRLFITLVLYREEIDKDKKIKSNKNLNAICFEFCLFLSIPL